MTIELTQADRDAANKAFDIAFQGDTTTIDDDMAELFARHRLERSAPVGCQYPVHGSVTHVRNVECCDFCGHPADTTPPEPVAEIERLRRFIEGFAKSLEMADFANVEGALAEGMCCNGQMCGCHGSSVGSYLAHELRTCFAAALGGAS